jgi:hypothetical protein
MDVPAIIEKLEQRKIRLNEGSYQIKLLEAESGSLVLTGKLYDLRLRVKCTIFCNLLSWARTYAVLVIGL